MKWVLTVAGSLVALVAGVYLGTVGTSIATDGRAETVAVEQWDSIRATYSEEMYEAATAPFEGELDAELVALLPATVSDSVVLIALKGEDCLTCEDLGRQLRELQSSLRRRGSTWPTVAVVDSAGVRTLRRFLYEERLSFDAVVVHDPERLLEAEATYGTPAVLVLDPVSAGARGVAHPSRFKNARPRSFAEELGLSR